MALSGSVCQLVVAFSMSQRAFCRTRARTPAGQLASREVNCGRQHFQALYDETLTQLPGVQRLTSTLIMKTVVSHHAPLRTQPTTR